MNFIPQLNRLTTIKRHNIFVVGLSVVIAASFWIAPLLSNKEVVYGYRTFRTAVGWGYEILVKDTVLIHQDFIPAFSDKKGFAEQQHAKQAAILVIEKIKAGKNPAINRQELETIVAANI